MLTMEMLTVDLFKSVEGSKIRTVFYIVGLKNGLLFRIEKLNVFYIKWMYNSPLFLLEKICPSIPSIPHIGDLAHWSHRTVYDLMVTHIPNTYM